MPPHIHGSTVDKATRKLRYVSPSAMQLADMSTEKGCLRKWYYAYVEGKKEPTTKQQAEGTADHAVVEKYLETGKRIFSPRVAKGIHMLPPPGPHLHIEHDMVPILWEGRDTCEACIKDIATDHTCKQVSGLHLAPLTAAGIPVIGRIDLLHDLGMNYGSDSFEESKDPEGTVEVFDHKFTKDLRYALKGPELLRTIQMVAYGEYVFRVIPGTKYVRLSHGYYPHNGNARKATVRTERGPLSRFWMEHVEPLARSMEAAAKEPTADTVPANTKACRAFNRECMHASYCSAGMQGSLASLVGQTAAQALLKKDTTTPMPLVPGKGLLAHLQKPPAADTAAREAELAKLKAEETEAKRKALPPGLFGVIQQIETLAQKNELGWPKLVGPALEAYMLLAGQGRDALGALEAVEIDTVDKFDTLLKELTEAYGAIPADEVPPAPATGSAPVALIPDDAPGAIAAPPAPPAADPNPMADIAAAADAPKKPRKPRAAKVIEATATEAAPPAEAPADAPPAESPPPPAPAAAPATGVINLAVDVVTEGGTWTDLAPLVDLMADALAKRFSLDDCRLGDAQSAIGFGKWKAALAAMTRESNLPNGNYKLDARGNEIYEEVAQAMRQVCRRTGGVWMRGTGR